MSCCRVLLLLLLFGSIGFHSTPALKQFLLYCSRKWNRNRKKKNVSLFILYFFPVIGSWVLFSRLALVSTATRQGIVGMLRISDSFSRPYQWTLVITLLSTLTFQTLLTSYLTMIFSLWVGILYTQQKHFVSYSMFSNKKLVVFTSARSFFCYFRRNRAVR